MEVVAGPVLLDTSNGLPITFKFNNVSALNHGYLYQALVSVINPAGLQGNGTSEVVLVRLQVAWR